MNHRETDPLRPLREALLAGEEAAVARARGAVICRQVAAAIRRVPAQRRARRRVTLAGAGAITLVGLCATLALMTGKRSVAVATEMSTLRPGQEISTSESGSALALAGGTRVSVAARSRLHMSDGSHALRLILDRGRVDLEVPPLSPGQSLVVQTPHAEVIVHGTAFAVEIVRAVDGREGTKVSVEAGVVSVRRRPWEVPDDPGKSPTGDGGQDEEIKLTRGGRWSSLDEVPVAGDPALPEPIVTRRSLAEPHARERPARPAERRVASSLALENQLFQDAARARQRGDEREAIRLFDELLRTYPDSALAPEAFDQRRRAEQRLQRR